MDFYIIESSEKYIEDIYKLYEANNFYYNSKRPDTLNEGTIKNIVMINNTFLLFYKKSLLGIFIYENDEFCNDTLIVKAEFCENTIKNHLIKVMVNFLKNKSPNCKYIKTLVYEFDEYMLELYEDYGFSIEAIYEGYVYKYGKYNNAYIYSFDLGDD